MADQPAPKISKLLWLLLMIGLMVVYLLLISRLIDALFSGNIILEVICYLVAGIIWIFPAKWVMFKINATDNTGEN